MHYLQLGVGHYGVFNGSRFRSEIAPRIADFIAEHTAVARRRSAKPVVRQPLKAVSVAVTGHGARANSSARNLPGLLVCGRRFGAFSTMSAARLALPAAERTADDPVVFDGEIYLVRVRRHRQARRYTLRIQAATREVVLTMPPRGSLKRGQEFAAEARRLDRGAAAAACRRPSRSPTARSCRCAAIRIGSCIARVRAARSGSKRRRMASACFAWPATRRMSTAASAISSPRGQARSRRGQPRAAEQLGVTVKRVSIRDQSSRWGSCSTTGVLSYSWRLILAPPFVLDYLAAHEVAHLVEMNHSRALLASGGPALPECQACQGVARLPRRRAAPLRYADEAQCPRVGSWNSSCMQSPACTGSCVKAPDAEAQHLRADRAARCADRARAAVDRSVSAVVAGYRPRSARRRRRCS